MSRQAHSPALTLETTTIQNRLAGDACLSYRIGESLQTIQSYTLGAEARFSECLMMMETSSTGPVKVTTSSFRVSLSQFDAARTTVRDGLQMTPNSFTAGDLPLFSIRLVTTKQQKLIEVETETIEGGATTHETHKASELDILVKGKEAATQLADAFRRAITLCARGARNNSRE
jgi:hypothetical protein